MTCHAQLLCSCRLLIHVKLVSAGSDLHVSCVGWHGLHTRSLFAVYYTRTHSHMLVFVYTYILNLNTCIVYILIYICLFICIVYAHVYRYIYMYVCTLCPPPLIPMLAPVCRRGRCVLQAYDQQLWSTLERVLLAPLCHHIESGLRLQHHAALLTGVPPINPNSSDVLDVTPLLQVPALQLSTRLVDIRYLPPTTSHIL